MRRVEQPMQKWTIVVVTLITATLANIVFAQNFHSYARVAGMVVGPRPHKTPPNTNAVQALNYREAVKTSIEDQEKLI
jgi:hypothetical protein